MATLDKQSVREEFDKIKAGFDEQVKAGKVTSEVATLVNTLILLFSSLAPAGQTSEKNFF
jgi:hypothetical protein